MTRNYYRTGNYKSDHSTCGSVIYNYVIEENQKYERMYEKNKCEDYLDKIRNTDIFDKYYFLNRE